MSSTYSNNLRVELIGSGDQAGTWGTTTDNNFAYIFDSAIAGINTVTITSVNQALTYVNGPTSTAALNQSIYAILKFNSAAAASAIYAPPVSKQYIIWNNTSYTITIYNSTVIGNTTAAGTGIAIAAGEKIMVWSDGTNFYDLQVQNLTGTLAIAKGGTGQTTANAAFNALAPSQASASGKYLKSDGTNTAFDQIDISTGDITGTLPVVNGGTGVTTSTGTGNTVLSTSPTLVTPILGTPTSGTMTNVTGLPLTTGVTGTLPVVNGGTGVTTSTGTGDTVLSTSPTITSPAISGTPTGVGVLTSGTVTNTTGTSVSITGIPSWVKRITVMFNNVTISGTTVPAWSIQIGPSAGVESTGYVGFSLSGATVSTSTTGFIFRGSGTASAATNGTFTLNLQDLSTNTWCASGVQQGGVATNQYGAGTKSLAGTLTQLALVTNGTDTFTAGSVNILYE